MLEVRQLQDRKQQLETILDVHRTVGSLLKDQWDTAVFKSVQNYKERWQTLVKAQPHPITHAMLEFDHGLNFSGVILSRPQACKNTRQIMFSVLPTYLQEYTSNKWIQYFRLLLGLGKERTLFRQFKSDVLYKC